mgnify:FL=1
MQRVTKVNLKYSFKLNNSNKNNILNTLEY